MRQRARPNPFLARLALPVVALASVVMLYSAPSSFTGVGGGQVITTAVKKDKSDRVTEKVTTTTPLEPKSLWDWMSLLGVPLVLTFLGYKLQRAERARSIEHIKEDALLNYLDQISELLIEKNLVAKAKAIRTDWQENERSAQSLRAEKETVDAAKDVIRARTLSILRFLENDGTRKGSVMNFLVEANVIGQLDLNLKYADLSSADLKGLNLKGAKLNHSNLRGADLTGANLKGIHLYNADLSDAILDQSILVDARLTEAKLWRTRLRSANLRDVVLNKALLVEADLTHAELQPWGKRGALLDGSDLRKANLSNANVAGVNFSAVTNLTRYQILRSANWENAIFSKATWNENNNLWEPKNEDTEKASKDAIRKAEKHASLFRWRFDSPIK
jgi:uncharacterized protein YjbI with pentapeptide repeats